MANFVTDGDKLCYKSLCFGLKGIIIRIASITWQGM